MTERMPAKSDDITITPDEPWWDGTEVRWAHYKAQEEYVAKYLGQGSHRWCLVIGSPMTEVHHISDNDWQVIFLDVRHPANCKTPWIVCDATDMRPNVSDNRFDAISSTCVLCHAGLGRYGDPAKPNGDVLMMQEMFRVLRPGGVAVIQAGPSIPWLQKSYVHGNIHRVYQPCEVAVMASKAGFEFVEMALWVNGNWMSGSNVTPHVFDNGDVEYHYLSMILRKRL